MIDWTNIAINVTTSTISGVLSGIAIFYLTLKKKPDESH